MAVDSTQTEAWAEFVKHTEREEEDYRRKIAADSVMESIVINTAETDSSEEELDTDRE